MVSKNKKALIICIAINGLTISSYFKCSLENLATLFVCEHCNKPRITMTNI